MSATKSQRKKAIFKGALTFRPHHFLCALCFQGKGYSPKFIDNFKKIMAALNSSNGDITKIKIVDHTDSICHPCPNRKGMKCTSQEKIVTLDKAHAKALGITSAKEITWGEAKRSIAEKISLDKFHEICVSCDWKKLGICEKALGNFLKKPIK